MIICTAGEGVNAARNRYRLPVEQHVVALADEVVALQFDPMRAIQGDGVVGDGGLLARCVADAVDADPEQGIAGKGVAGNKVAPAGSVAEPYADLRVADRV